MVKIAPSILTADYNNLEKEIAKLSNDGADLIHIDVMDGMFVSNETPGMDMYIKAKENTSLCVDTHLMVEDPESWIDKFILYNEENNFSMEDDIISFHIESVNESNAYRLINKLQENGIKASIAIKPDTSVDDILPLLPLLDMVLVMTVEPGYGGQAMIEKCLDKVKEIRELEPELDIEVDGGINLETASLAIDAGANVLVSGTAIFKSLDMKETIKRLRNS